MALAVQQNRSRFVTYIAIFTALAAIFDAIPIIPGLYSGIWASWLFLFHPLIGVLLGPIYGAISVGFGSLLGHFIYYRDPFEFLFMLGAAFGAACTALVYQRRWKPVLVFYTLLLIGYFLSPVSWLLPLIGIWDILLGYLILLLFSLLRARQWWPSNPTRSQWLGLLFAVVIGLEADILLRVFILIPGQAYWLFYGWTPEFLQFLWLTAGIITPTKVAIATLFTVTLGYSLLQILPRLGVPPTSDFEAQRSPLYKTKQGRHNDDV
ncbi:MAG: hypothetical protein ACFE89_01095 [Candidatus Hodarchaeota archaeon]